MIIHRGRNGIDGQSRMMIKSRAVNPCLGDHPIATNTVITLTETLKTLKHRIGVGQRAENDVCNLNSFSHSNLC